ncbi:MAG: tellurite resistance/C4-dicarboxylate transporter family protein [Rhodoblastus sp.]
MAMTLQFRHGRPETLETLHPAHFALVMATAIVARTASLHNVEYVPDILLYLNIVFIVTLTAASVLRMARYPKAFAADIRSHGRGVGFFTVVAGFGVFGAQLIFQRNAVHLASAIWSLAIVLWLVITYGELAVLTCTPEKPSIEQGLNGGWLVVVVATQSLSILTCLVQQADPLAGLREPLMFAALALWLGGGALYLWLMTLIFYRYTFVRMSPEDLTPPYWINMGAVAISTLAGATLLQHASLSPTIQELSIFIKGLTLAYWSIGTWWIPMLLVLGVWRYLIIGVPFAYDPLYWGGVFPLGMYSVCTFALAQVLGAPFLYPVSSAFMVLALIAWTVTFAGMVDSFLHARASEAVGKGEPQ